MGTNTAKLRVFVPPGMPHRDNALAELAATAAALVPPLDIDAHLANDGVKVCGSPIGTDTFAAAS